jgi:hypothetical protein
MPNLVRVTQGSYLEAFGKVEYPSECALFFQNLAQEDSYIESLTTILKDLRREPVELTAEMTEEDHVSKWVSSANALSNTYSQGNLSASFVKILVDSFCFSSRYLKENTERTAENQARFCSVNDSNEYAHFSTAYYLDSKDEENTKIACGVAIFASKRDPSVWVMAAFKNSTAHPEKIEVMLVTAPEIMNNSEEGLVAQEEAQAKFLEFVGDQTIRTLLSEAVEQGKEETTDLFLPNGGVNTKKVEALHQRSNWLSDEQKERLQIKQEQLTMIKKCYMEYRDRQEPLKFESQKKAFDEKEKTTRQQIEENYKKQMDPIKKEIENHTTQMDNKRTKCSKKYQQTHKKNYDDINISKTVFLFFLGIGILVVAAATPPVSIPAAIGLAIGGVAWLGGVLLSGALKIRKAEKKSQQEFKKINEEYQSFCKEQNGHINACQNQISLLNDGMKLAQKKCSDAIRAEKTQFEKDYYNSPLLVNVCHEVILADMSLDEVKEHCEQRFNNHKPVKSAGSYRSSHYDPHFYKQEVEAKEEEAEARLTSNIKLSS